MSQNKTAILFLLKLTLFTGAMIISVHGTAQECEYEKNEIDALTELVVKRTVPEILLRINGQPVYIKGQSIGTNKYLKVQYYKYSNYVIQEDREVAFVLSNDEEVTLFPRPMPVDSTKMNDYSDLSTLLIFKLNDEQFQKLKSTPIVLFKYHLISGFVEEPIKGAKQLRLMELLHCLE
ncbi:MAG: hypothetical protein M0P66_01405 [Salinivirgaceae bacterium]|nr:hypothetical protein [Salinivirgaceae bacterium]